MTMTTKLFDVAGKRVLITGSSGGLGLELARGFLLAGSTVILNGRSEAKLDAVVESLRHEKLDASGYSFDVGKEDEVKEAVAQIGRIEVLINNAGIQRRASLENVSLELWEDVLRTNLTSAFLVAREVAPGMIERGSGKIVNICSLMSDLGRTTTGPYTAAKGGLKMLTKAMCADWAKHNIQVNGIGPGYFLTEMTRPLANDPDFDKWVKGRTPAGRWGTPSELVGAAIFLSSEASSFMNGQILYIDGGMSAIL
jgi:gluconate 5-dehydrogenase